MSIQFLILWISVVLFQSAFAQKKIISEKVETLTGEQVCRGQQNCLLQEVTLLVRKLEYRVGGARTPDRMTDRYLAYRTQRVSQIEDVAVVQFIKGCIYRLEKRGQEWTKELTYHREHMGQSRLFIHRDWEVDTDTLDPIHTDYLGNRFGLLRWNDDGSMDANKSHFYIYKKPSIPFVYQTDLPSAAALFDSGTLSAQVPSLEFNICLFKTVDLPLTTDASGSNIDVTKALRCFSWSHNYRLNTKTLKFSEAKSIDAICR